VRLDLSPPTAIGLWSSMPWRNWRRISPTRALRCASCSPATHDRRLNGWRPYGRNSSVRRRPEADDTPYSIPLPSLLNTGEPVRRYRTVADRFLTDLPPSRLHRRGHRFTQHRKWHSSCTLVSEQTSKPIEGLPVARACCSLLRFASGVGLD
jgi:hypothetical protein